MKLPSIVGGALLMATLVTPLAAQTQSSAKSAAAPPASSAAATPTEKRVEEFLRNIYAWDKSFTVKVGPAKPSAIADLDEVPVVVTAEGGSDSAVVYVTKDGHYMFRGEIQDLHIDPLAETRKKLHTDGYAYQGPANAKVTIVEFGDFECPSCRQLDILFRNILPMYPQVRLVFKDLPLESIHPWAMTASIAGRCALQQSNATFWKLHDAIYDNQDLITPENAYSKLADLSKDAGADPDKFKACIADPATAGPVKASVDEARSVQINSTPTSFVNGRRMVGPDPNILKQFLEFELAQASSPTPPPTENADR